MMSKIALFAKNTLIRISLTQIDRVILNSSSWSNAFENQKTNYFLYVILLFCACGANSMRENW